MEEKTEAKGRNNKALALRGCVSDQSAGRSFLSLFTDGILDK